LATGRPLISPGPPAEQEVRKYGPPRALKPEPAKFIVEPWDPLVGESTKLGITVNVGIAAPVGLSPAAFPVTVT
jgi:hypothetical protein